MGRCVLPCGGLVPTIPVGASVGSYDGRDYRFSPVGYLLVERLSERWQRNDGYNRHDPCLVWILGDYNITEHSYEAGE